MARELVRRVRRNLLLYLLLAPTFLMLSIFTYYPTISAFYHSLFIWDSAVLEKYIGLANFRELFGDRIFLKSMVNITKLTAFRMVIAATIPLIFAELIFNLRSLKSQYYYRTFFVIPMVVPTMVLILVWGFIYDPIDGILNQFLRLLGLGQLEKVWLGDFNTALYAIMGLGFPWIAGINLLIYYAGLQNIPRDVFDSSLIDGAHGLSRFVYIDVPLVASQMKLVVILAMIAQLQGFEWILILTGGGPADSTMVPGLYLYQNAFMYSKMGYACAIGVFLFCIILALTYINMKYVKSSVEYTA